MRLNLVFAHDTKFEGELSCFKCLQPSHLSNFLACFTHILPTCEQLDGAKLLQDKLKPGASSGKQQVYHTSTSSLSSLSDESDDVPLYPYDKWEAYYSSID